MTTCCSPIDSSISPPPLLDQVAFKSEYLQLFQAQQITASELLVAKEALAEAKLVSVTQIDVDMQFIPQAKLLSVMRCSSHVFV